MTILNEEYVKRIADSGTTIDISNFGIRATTEVLITKYDGTSDATLAITTDYTINATLTTVTLNNALTSGERAVATLTIADTTSTDYEINSSDNAETLEDSLDKLTLNIKKKQERTDRVLANQISSDITGIEFDSFDGSANKFTKVDEAEEKIVFSNLGGQTLWGEFTLPGADGSANEVLRTDGSATLPWTGTTTNRVNTVAFYCEFRTSDLTIIRASDTFVSIEEVSAGNFLIVADTAALPPTVNGSTSVSFTKLNPAITDSLMVIKDLPTGAVDIRIFCMRINNLASPLVTPAGDTRILVIMLKDVAGINE